MSGVVSVRQRVRWRPAAAVLVKLQVGLVGLTRGSDGFGGLGGSDGLGRGSWLLGCLGELG